MPAKWASNWAPSWDNQPPPAAATTRRIRRQPPVRAVPVSREHSRSSGRSDDDRRHVAQVGSGRVGSPPLPLSLSPEPSTAANFPPRHSKSLQCLLHLTLKIGHRSTAVQDGRALAGSAHPAADSPPRRQPAPKCFFPSPQPHRASSALCTQGGWVPHVHGNTSAARGDRWGIWILSISSLQLQDCEFSLSSTVWSRSDGSNLVRAIILWICYSL
jgi:hypothetical protein